MALTFKQAEKLHKELWGWLYKHPLKEKWDWPRWVNNGVDIPILHLYCFACQYDCCPMDWNAKDCMDSYYRDWCHAKLPKERKNYAAIIRDLPWRKK